MFNFDYDPDKSQRNLDKHGIDFERAQRLWDDPYLYEVPLDSEPEPRWLVVAALDGKRWSAIITYRDGGIRLISVRRARRGEEALYEDTNH